jgi:hypothetical protein
LAALPCDPKGYRELLDRSNLSIGWTAAAFLSAVTPGSKGRYDPRFDPARLVSGAGALANASFFLVGFRYSSAVLLCYLIPST